MPGRSESGTCTSGTPTTFSGIATPTTYPGPTNTYTYTGPSPTSSGTRSERDRPLLPTTTETTPDATTAARGELGAVTGDARRRVADALVLVGGAALSHRRSRTG